MSLSKSLPLVELETALYQIPALLEPETAPQGALFPDLKAAGIACQRNHVALSRASDGFSETAP